MIDKAIEAEILARYDDEAYLYTDFAATTSSLIERILKGNDVQLHSM